ncbi:MAG: SDR family oxidoreductase [Chloroflexota bacterium]|nr:SDR family oxidoreductase [Chloroflexota bacterium]
MANIAVDERVVLVTGAANGIGRAIARRFGAGGCRVVAMDFRGEDLEHSVDELRSTGAEVLAIQADVRDASQVEAAVTQTVERFGRLDVGVSNAAVYPNTAVVDMDEAEWDLVLDTNLKGAFLVTRAVARQMLRQANGGKLCLIASGAYSSARRGAAHYSASKAGLVMLAKTLALELAEHRINVNVVSPGLVAVGDRPGVSEHYKQVLLQTIPWGRPGSPDEIASAVLFVCSPEAEYLTGSVMSVDGGSSAGRNHLPWST